MISCCPLEIIPLESKLQTFFFFFSDFLETQKSVKAYMQAWLLLKVTVYAFSLPRTKTDVIYRRLNESVTTVLIGTTTDVSDSLSGGRWRQLLPVNAGCKLHRSV